MFSQASVCPQREDVRGKRGACVAKGGMNGEGARCGEGGMYGKGCVCGRVHACWGYAWQRGVHGGEHA